MFWWTIQRDPLLLSEGYLDTSAKDTLLSSEALDILSSLSFVRPILKTRPSWPGAVLHRRFIETFEILGCANEFLSPFWLTMLLWIHWLAMNLSALSSFLSCSTGCASGMIPPYISTLLQPCCASLHPREELLRAHWEDSKWRVGFVSRVSPSLHLVKTCSGLWSHRTLSCASC